MVAGIKKEQGMEYQIPGGKIFSPFSKDEVNISIGGENLTLKGRENIGAVCQALNKICSDKAIK
jgi:hypothetical protein